MRQQHVPVGKRTFCQWAELPGGFAMLKKGVALALESYVRRVPVGEFDRQLLSEDDALQEAAVKLLEHERYSAVALDFSEMCGLVATCARNHCTATGKKQYRRDTFAREVRGLAEPPGGRTGDRSARSAAE